MALEPVPASISGTEIAELTAQVPITNNVKAANFMN